MVNQIYGFQVREDTMMGYDKAPPPLYFWFMGSIITNLIISLSISSIGLPKILRIDENTQYLPRKHTAYHLLYRLWIPRNTAYRDISA